MLRAATTGLSMAPLLLPKDFPLVAKVAAYKENDIVVFKLGERLVAHRAVYIDSQKGLVVTKGDANQKADGYFSRNEILGKVDKIKRDGKTVNIRHIYLTQSSIYLGEIGGIVRQFSKNKIKYVILKGLPLYLSLTGKPPDKLYLDIDILVQKTDFLPTWKVLEEAGFSGTASEVLGRKITAVNQVSFVKQAGGFPVVVDLHLEAAVGFTRTTFANKLLPSFARLSKFFLEDSQSIKIGPTKFRILSYEALFIYLLLHFFHHNFQGASRMSLVNVLSGLKINWKRVIKIAKRFRLNNFLHPSLLMVYLYYPKEVFGFLLEKFQTRFFEKQAARIISKTVNPFNEDERIMAGIKRFLMLFIFSPKGFWPKLEVVFSKETFFYFLRVINFFLLSTFRKLSTSLFALFLSIP